MYMTGSWSPWHFQSYFVCLFCFCLCFVLFCFYSFVCFCGFSPLVNFDCFICIRICSIFPNCWSLSVLAPSLVVCLSMVECGSECGHSSPTVHPSLSRKHLCASSSQLGNAPYTWSDDQWFIYSLIVLGWLFQCVVGLVLVVQLWLHL